MYRHVSVHPAASRRPCLGAAIAAAAAALALGTGMVIGAGSHGSLAVFPNLGIADDLNEPISIDSACSNCHNFDPDFSHPVGVTPNGRVPSHLPLEEGRISCVTCHDDSDHGRAGDRIRPTLDAPSFCAQCHDGSTAERRAGHGSVGRAHLQVNSTETTPGLASPGLYDETRTCMACHDGMVAADAGRHVSATTSNTNPVEHPVGIPYREREARRRGIDLVSLHRLDPRVRLFDGLIGCGSCHSVYSSEADLLVMSNLRSKLCLACHAQ